MKKTGMICRCIMACLVAIAIIVSLFIANMYTNKYSSLVSVYFNAETQKIINDEEDDSNYFTSDYSNEAEMKRHLEEVGSKIEEEGAVLLENNGALPLEKNLKITLLGQDSADLVYGGENSMKKEMVHLTEKQLLMHTEMENSPLTKYL